MSSLRASQMTHPVVSGEEAPTARRRAVLFVGLGAQADSRGSTAQDLQRRMGDLAATLPPEWRVLHAEFRGQPCIAGALAVFRGAGVDELIVIPQYPHFSRRTTGVALAELYRVLRQDTSPMGVAVRTSWHDDAAYVNAQAAVVAQYVSAHGVDPADTHLWCWAHAVPGGEAEDGDPYESYVRRTLALVTEHLGWPRERVSLTFVDPTTPVTPPDDGNLLICPLTFPMDRAAVLARLGLPDQEAGGRANGHRLHVCPALDTQDAFVSALRDIVLRGTRPMPSSRGTAEPLLGRLRSQRSMADRGTLVMVGAAVRGRLLQQGGPAIRYSDPDAFARIKQPRKVLRELLQWSAARTPATDAFVWNTCQRVEFYGWLGGVRDVAECEYQVARIRHRLFGTEPDDLRVNVLFAQEAWHHLARTACGLNSRLPGDRDIVEQLQAAGRVAVCAGAAGPHTTRAIEEAASLADDVCRETAWGRFSTGYCSAALTQLLGCAGTDPGAGRHVVIGGSTTSRSILSTLARRFEVPQDQLTIVYRDHHGQLKLIRAAIGHGRRLRVHSYSDGRVLEAVREADFLYFGIDSAEPVLQSPLLHDLRDFEARPLSIIDFNSWGSLSDGRLPCGVAVWAARAVDDAVEAYADALCDRADFWTAAAEAERWIARRSSATAAVPEQPSRATPRP